MVARTRSFLRSLALGLVAALLGGLALLTTPLAAQAVTDFVGSESVVIKAPGNRSEAEVGDTLTLDLDLSGLKPASPSTPWSNGQEPHVLSGTASWAIADSATASTSDMTFRAFGDSYQVAPGDAGKFLIFTALVRAEDDSNIEYERWVRSAGMKVATFTPTLQGGSIAVQLPPGRSVPAEGDELLLDLAGVNFAGLSWDPRTGATGWTAPHLPQPSEIGWYIADDAAGTNMQRVPGLIYQPNLLLDATHVGKYLFGWVKMHAKDNRGNDYDTEYFAAPLGPVQPLTPPTVGSVETTVNSGGLPLSGATVTAYIAGTDTTVSTDATTDANGKAIIADLPPGSYDLMARKSGYVDGITAQPVEVVAGQLAAAAVSMTQFATVTISVEDEDGNPIEGALVLAIPLGGGVPVLLSTGVTGTIDFELLPGVYSFAAGKPGYDGDEHASAPRTLVSGPNAPDAPLKMQRIKTGALEVTVRDDQAAAVEGAEVVVKRNGSEVARFTSGPNGAVNFGNLPIGDYAVEVSATGFTPVLKDPIAVADGAVVPVEVELSRVISTPDPTTPSTSPQAPTLPDGVAQSGPVVVPDETPAGAPIDVFVGAAYAGQTVHLWMFSTPTYLGQFTVNAQGYATGVHLPQGATGVHRVAAVSVNGDLIGWDTTRIAGLATTGGSDQASALVLGAVALLLGAGLLVVRRRRVTGSPVA